MAAQGYEVANDKGERAWWDGKKLTPLDANGMQVTKPKSLNNQEQIRLKEATDGAEGARGLAQAANLFVDLNKKSGTGVVNAIPGVAAVRSMFDPNIRQMRSLTARMAPQQRVPGSGTTSDKDLELFLQAVPEMSSPGNANAAIAKDITNLSTRRAARAAFLDRWAEKKGTLMGADQAFAKFWTDYSSPKSDQANPFNASAKGKDAAPAGVIRYDAQGNRIK